jgi:hypothetical protein
MNEVPPVNVQPQAVQPVMGMVYFETRAANPAPAASSSTNRPASVHSAVVSSNVRTVGQLVTALHQSASTGERMWCAQSLANCDCRRNPEIVDALIKSARNDADTMVRVACIRGLAHLGARQPSVFAALEVLQSDSDMEIRYEASVAYRKLDVAHTSPSVR